MTWSFLTSGAQLATLIKDSYSAPQIIFKHSTRCHISTMVKTRLDKAAGPENIPFYFLDLITYRSLSNTIAEKFSVHHESPQVLLIKNGECVYDESHIGIQMDEIVEQAA